MAVFTEILWPTKPPILNFLPFYRISWVTPVLCPGLIWGEKGNIRDFTCHVGIWTPLWLQGWGTCDVCQNDNQMQN